MHCTCVSCAPARSPGLQEYVIATSPQGSRPLAPTSRLLYRPGTGGEQTKRATKKLGCAHASSHAPGPYRPMSRPCRQSACGAALGSQCALRQAIHARPTGACHRWIAPPSRPRRRWRPGPCRTRWVLPPLLARRCLDRCSIPRRPTTSGVGVRVGARARGEE